MSNTTYYAVCDAGGPISVKLDASTKAEALAAFEALDGCAAIDGAKTDAENDLGIEGADNMSEGQFAEALEAAGAEHVCGLEPIVNAHAGTVSDLLGGWALWSVRGQGANVSAWTAARVASATADLTFVTPPENQGQMVTTSYASDADHVYARTYDSSDRSAVMRVYEPDDSGEAFEPWNRVPSLGALVASIEVQS